MTHLWFIQVNDLQVELTKLQSHVVSLQMEQKELKKKQRRSERYYTNKGTKDVGSQKEVASSEDGGEDIGQEEGDDGEMGEDPGWSSNDLFHLKTN